ncbi:MAG: energy-coupled thiamine transporter ThiT [Lachnospiraceae bacterium]|nr:energy-coupled thiamine transporter ThiT [Lachnospiraceae bacterium]
MNNFFATPTDVWGDDAVALTPTGIGIIVAVIAVALIVILFASYKKSKSANITTKQLVYCAMALALALVTSNIKLAHLPMGGSVTLLSMLFITLIGYWYGPVVGISTGIAYGLLQFVMSPIFYTIPQMLTDYPLAFGALGLSGFFNRSKFGLSASYLAGVIGRFFFAFLSGWIFFGEYASYYNMAAVPYSIVYNGAYIFSEAILTLVIINIPPVKNALLTVKHRTLEEY